MSLDKVNFSEDDKPVFNQFDKLVLCDEEGETCCAPCADWLECLLQSFYTVKLGGIDFTDWLPGHWLDGNTQYADEQGNLGFSVAGGGTPVKVIFDGTFLAEPPVQDSIAQSCPFPSREDECTHTHRMRHERTIATNSPEADIVKRFGMNVNTECLVIGDDKYLQFTLNLVWQGCSGPAVYEPAINPDDGFGNPIYCPPKPETPYDPSEGSNAWFCCPLAKSDLILISSLSSLADLSSVVLHKLPPYSSTFNGVDVWIPDSNLSQSCLQKTNTWVCCIGVQLIECVGGAPVCLYQGVGDNCQYYTVNGEDATIIPPPEEAEEGEALGCTSSEYSGGCGSPGSGTCEPSYCISAPLVFEASDIILSVIDGKCKSAEGCKSCFNDPESPVATPIKPGDVRFETDSAETNCNKVFTVVHPPCLTIDKVYWSDGEVTDGDDPHTVNLDSLSSDDITNKAQISALIVMTNGCIYCWTEEFTCGCCEGLIGSLSMVVDPDVGCDYTFTAHISGNDLCPQAYIEVQFGGESCPPTFDDGCTCEQLFEGEEADPPCESYGTCTFGLGDGQTVTRNVDQVQKVRYRVVDGPCGCAGPWIEFPIYCGVCDCCLGTVINVEAIIANWGSGVPCCEGVDGSYQLEPVALGFNCQWRYGYAGGVGEGDSIICGESEYGIQMDFVISCNTADLGDPSIYELKATLNVTAAGIGTWEWIVVDAVEFDGVLIPGNCEALSGFGTLIASVDGGCNPALATAFLNVTVG